MCTQKLMASQLNLPHGTKNKKKRNEPKTNNQYSLEDNGLGEVCGVSPEAGRESTVGRICASGRF